VYEDLDAVSELLIRGIKRIHRLLAENRTQAFLMKRLATIDSNVPVAAEWPVKEISATDIRSMTSQYQHG